MGLLIFLIIFFIYVAKSPEREEEPLSQEEQEWKEWLRKVNAGDD